MCGLPWDADGVAARAWLEGGHRYCFHETVGNFPAAVGGYVQVELGRFASWFMATPEAWARGNQITERVAEVVRDLLDNPDVIKLETTTLASREKARAWYTRIGLAYESTGRLPSGTEFVTYSAYSRQ
jgi:hypothetical protein